MWWRIWSPKACGFKRLDFWGRFGSSWGPFWVQLGVRGAIWLVVLAVSLTFLLGNLAIAHRWQHQSVLEDLPLVQGTNWKPI